MNKRQYSYQRFYTYTLPQIEAKENSEMAYNSHHAVLSASETAKETYYHSYCCNIRKNKEFLLLAVFNVLCLEFNLDVISNELQGGPVSHFRKLHRFAKEFYRWVNSSSGGFSFLQVLVETFHKHQRSFIIYCKKGHQHRTSTSCQESTCNTDHTLTLQDSASSTVTAT